MQPQELGQRAGILAIKKARGGARLLLLGVLVYKINELISFYGSTLQLLLLFQLVGSRVRPCVMFCRGRASFYVG